MNFRAARKHFADYLRGVVRGHPGVRIGHGVKLGGPGKYDLSRGCQINRDSQLWVGEGATLTMLPGSKLGDRAIVNVESKVSIGAGVRISWDVQILDTDFHWIEGSDGRIHQHTRPILIEDRVLIGASTIILKGVTLGTGSVVGAGSVVRRSIAPRTVVGGNPAAKLGDVANWGSAARGLPTIGDRVRPAR